MQPKGDRMQTTPRRSWKMPRLRALVATLAAATTGALAQPGAGEANTAPTRETAAAIPSLLPSIAGFFDAEFLTGTLPDLAEIDALASPRLYDGVPASFAITTTLTDAGAADARVVASNDVVGVILDEPLIFTGGVSQGVMLPGTPFGSTTEILVAWRGMVLGPYEVFAAEAGPATAAAAIPEDVWGDLLTGAPDAIDASDPAQLLAEVGEGGAAIPLVVVSPPIPDDPLVGELATNDLYVAQLFDDMGRPAGAQTMTLTADDPGVIGFRGIGTDDPPAPSITLVSDDQGLVAVYVQYVGPGISGVTIESALLPAPFPAPDDLGMPAVFTALPPTPAPPPGSILDRENNLPDVVTLRVISCDGVPVNLGLRDSGALLTFGARYCFQANVNGPLPAGSTVVWCINGQLVRQSSDNSPIIGNRIYITWSDPQPNQPNTIRFNISAKVVAVDAGEAFQPKSEKKTVFTLREKKTVPLCVLQYGATANTNAQLAAEIARVNALYTGTGVCVSLNPADISNLGGPVKTFNPVCLPPPMIGPIPVGFGSINLVGTLIPCICNNANQQGSATKITIYNGLTIPGTILGNATGANEVVGDNPGYDVCGKYANTVMMRTGTIVSGQNVLAHEICHILGLKHMAGVGRCMNPTVNAGTNSVLVPTEAATMYGIACEILDGQK